LTEETHVPDWRSANDLRRALAPLVTGHDGDEHVLGRPDLGLYVAVPEPGVVLIAALQDGATLDEATERASQVAGAPVDSVDFLDGLAEAGLLDDGAAPSQAPAGGRMRWLEGVSQRAARRWFGPVAWTAYGLCAVVALSWLAFRPDLRPSLEDVWFLGDPVLALLVYLPIALSFAAGHEAWHWLAGRAEGVPAAFRVSRRGIMIVFETDLTPIVVVPRRRRYGPFLAGMAFDVVVLAAALTTRALYRADVLAVPPLLDRVLGAVVLSQVIALIWQWAAIFMRSDGYAVLANALRCHNLHRASWLVTKGRLWRLNDAEVAELNGISAHDRRVARWFAVGQAVGAAGVGWLMVTLAVPFLVSMGLWVVNNLRSLAATSVAFWESVAVLLVLLLQWLVPPVLAWRERRLRKAGALL
jgi:hypothetical protein